MAVRGLQREPAVWPRAAAAPEGCAGAVRFSSCSRETIREAERASGGLHIWSGRVTAEDVE